MIVAMRKVRILGPRSDLNFVLETLQDVGIVHLCRPALDPPLAAIERSVQSSRHVAQIERALDDVEEAIARLESAAPLATTPAETPAERLPLEVRLARRARRSVVKLAGEQRAAEDERERVERLIQALEAFAGLELPGASRSTRTFYLLLSLEGTAGLDRFRDLLREAIGDVFVLHHQALEDGELAVALVVPSEAVPRIEALLPETGVRELELPEIGESEDPATAVLRLRERFSAIDGEFEGFEARRRRLATWLMPGLLRARAAFHDWLLKSAALSNAVATDHVFVIEGWLPAAESEALARSVAERCGESIVIEDLARESWSAQKVPVAIRNPRIFRSFEVITRWLPLPHYGTMDPTPFVAVFFPMFFGLILGDLGYGAVLGGLALIGRVRSRAESLLRSVSEVAATCAAFSMIFGFLFGEMFGDLGHRLFGLEAIAFSREDAFVPFLALAVALGFVHVLLGLVLGAISSFRHDRRESLGRGLSVVMLLLTAAALLAAVELLPSAFFTPVVIALLLTFPLLIALEGVLGPIEFLSRLSNILSYARIMALGTASVMLAIVANRMVGALGGAIVGVVFATLFHLVNFALGVFSPTIHALRLHFVEFYGTFYSPGGLAYRPLRHWRPGNTTTPQSATP